MTKISILFLLFIVGVLSCNTTKVKKVDYVKVVVSFPIPFAKGIISTEENSEFDLTFSPDGLKIYFSSRKPSEEQTIFESNFENGIWSSPKHATFSTDRDETTFITPNGNYFFFGSKRPIPNRGNFDMNVWLMEKTRTGWSSSQHLPEPINQIQIEKEEWPLSNNKLFFTNDNKGYYFTTMKRGTKSIKL